MDKANKNDNELDKQRENVTRLYDSVAPIYDDLFEGKAENQITPKLVEVYKGYGINEGTILDLGCGTGKLIEYLGRNFTYKGIDISSQMAEKAKKRGYEVFVGPIDEKVKEFADKSVDHIVAVSSLFFVKDWAVVAKEMQRVARKSIFVSLEQFEPEVIEQMKQLGINIYNHSASEIKTPTKVYKNTFLWVRPTTKERVEIFGDLVFKKY